MQVYFLLNIHIVSQGNYEGMEQRKIQQSIYQLSEKKLESNQAIMMKEIEDYIDKTMLEMHIALEELKLSFEDEIKGLGMKIFNFAKMRIFFLMLSRLLRKIWILN